MPLLDVKWRRRMAILNALVLGQLMFLIPGVVTALVGDEKAYRDFYENSWLKPDVIACLIYLVLCEIYLKWESRQFPKGLKWLPTGALIGIVVINIIVVFV